jgi:aldehyde dehydrogenase (NAD+)
MAPMTFAFDPAGLSLPRGHFIDGAYVAHLAALTVTAPSDGRALAEIPCADSAIVDQAVSIAQATLARSGWGTCAPRDRLRVLHAWADLMEAEAKTLAQLEAVCSPRPVTQVPGGDIAITAAQIRFFAEFADKECGDLVPTAADSFGYISHEPYGVVGAITPWNFPISMAGWKLGPALAAGNAVVLKPSEMTPYSSLYLAELAVRAGLPKGLLNVVVGDGPTTGAALTGHPGTAKVSFTGSTRAGGAIMEHIARTGIKPMTLELGGKSPQLVFEDADLELATTCLANGILPNAGQFCVAGSRMLVHRSVAEPLAEKLKTRFALEKPAATWDDPAGFSPIISARQMGMIDSIVQAVSMPK